MELIWNGKYNDEGRNLAPLKIALPFQTVETVTESAQGCDRNRNPFADGGETEWHNRLIWGHKNMSSPPCCPNSQAR